MGYGRRQDPSHGEPKELVSMKIITTECTTEDFYTKQSAGDGCTVTIIIIIITLQFSSESIRLPFVARVENLAKFVQQ
jgi:hypothetical protein